MPTWLEISKGPVFRFTLAVLVLGLLRLVLIATFGMLAALRRAGDRRLPLIQLTKETLIWLLPVARIHRARPLYSYASFSFHIGIILAGLFLLNHVDILASNLNIVWPSLPRSLLDVITLLATFGGSYLLAYRLYARDGRALSRLSDYLLLVLLLSILTSGYLAGQPWNPVPYNLLMLFHTINSLGLLILIPFTKIAHCVLFPLTRLGSEVAWHLTPQGGSDVTFAIHGPDGRRI